MAFPKQPLELYTHSVEAGLSKEEWQAIIAAQHCPFLNRRCIKTRKSEPDVTIGTCTVGYKGKPLTICPVRFLERRQIFLDVLHLLEQHVPGNQVHVVPEVTIPGGSVDYFVVSVQRGAIQDYLGLEIQTLDTTGTVGPSRQQAVNRLVYARDAQDNAGSREDKSYGINWKMTAKTILVQMHHKVETLELLGKKLVLVVQDAFYDYMTAEFSTSVLRDAETADAAHFHIYSLEQQGDKTFSLELTNRYSTTTVGIEQMLGLCREAQIPEQELITRIQNKISAATLLRI